MVHPFISDDKSDFRAKSRIPASLMIFFFYRNMVHPFISDEKSEFKMIVQILEIDYSSLYQLNLEQFG